MDYKKITMDDIRYLIEDSQKTYNRYNIEAVRPTIKKWPEGYIVDEGESVKWNREQVAAHNKEVENATKKYYQDLHKGYDNFCADLKQAIQNDYNFTESQANVILAHLHNDSMIADVDRAEELCEFIIEFLSSEDPKEVFHN